MLEIVIATGNAHKVRELAGLLKVAGIRWRSLADAPSAPRVRETGRTFEENAVKKAMAVARACGSLALADDSGLAVDALGGWPGVRSARYAGRHGGDAVNNAKLLKALRGLPASRRRARYHCVLALADPRRLLGVSDGTWAGRIAERPAGPGGFGYDPIFFVPRYRSTVGQLPSRVKQRLSHRAKAARGMRRLLRALARDTHATGGSRRGVRGRRAASGSAVGPG